MRKIILSFFILALVIPVSTISANNSPVVEQFKISAEGNQIPEDALLMEEATETFIYTLNENARALYVGEFKTSVYYSKISGVGVEYTFSCGGCQISSLSGTATIRDYWDYVYLTIPATSYGSGYNRVSFYKNTGKKFPAGITNLFVDYYLYANLLNGHVLNGNRVSNTVGPMTILKH